VTSWRSDAQLEEMREVTSTNAPDDNRYPPSAGNDQSRSVEPSYIGDRARHTDRLQMSGGLLATIAKEPIVHGETADTRLLTVSQQGLRVLRMRRWHCR
jgi:hypothetical protein